MCNFFILFIKLSNLIIQWGFNPATTQDRVPYIMNLPTSFSNTNYIFTRVPNAQYQDADVTFLLGASINSISQVQFYASNTRFTTGDNWFAICT